MRVAKVKIHNKWYTDRLNYCAAFINYINKYIYIYIQCTNLVAGRITKSGGPRLVDPCCRMQGSRSRNRGSIADSGKIMYVVRGSDRLLGSSDLLLNGYWRREELSTR